MSGTGTTSVLGILPASRVADDRIYPPGNDPRPRNDMRFGTVLRDTRTRRKDLTMSLLAQMADMDPSFISRLEKDTRRPTREAVDRIADALEASNKERDLLLVAAGFAPLSLVDLDPPSLVELAEAYSLANLKAKSQVMNSIEMMIEFLKANRREGH
jgi:transcriptional regulator with XRE-family HTH domain